MINTQMNLKEVVERWAEFTQEITENRYGYAPAIKVRKTCN